MSHGDSLEVTDLLKAWGMGDPGALDRLAPKVYEELRRMARRYMRDERARNTLQTTALVNEVYLRLVNVKDVGLKERAQFYTLCAQMMRRILVDAARTRGAYKRGGGVVKLDIDEEQVLATQLDASVLALNEAMEDLAKIAPRQARVVELRWFAGLSEQEVATLTGTSERTVRRDWKFAKAWLMEAISGSPR